MDRLEFDITNRKMISPDKLNLLTKGSGVNMEMDHHTSLREILNEDEAHEKIVIELSGRTAEE